MRITRNENIHIQNFCAGLPKLHAWEEPYSNWLSLSMWLPEWPERSLDRTWMVNSFSFSSRFGTVHETRALVGVLHPHIHIGNVTPCTHVSDTLCNQLKVVHKPEIQAPWCITFHWVGVDALKVLAQWVITPGTVVCIQNNIISIGAWYWWLFLPNLYLLLM